MKDKDFDDIGKRLYDMEAEPPKDGWRKIVVGVPLASGKIVFLRKNWWKPLVLLIPIGGYLLLPGTNENASVVRSADNVDSITVSSTTDDTNGFTAKTTEPKKTVDQSLAKEGIAKAGITKNQEITSQVIDQTGEDTVSQKKVTTPGKNESQIAADNSDTKITIASETRNNLTQIETEKALAEKETQSHKELVPSTISEPALLGNEVNTEMKNKNAELRAGNSKGEANKSTEALEIATVVKATDQEKRGLKPGENISEEKAPADDKKVLPAEADKSSISPTMGNTALVSSSLSQSTTPNNKVIEKTDSEVKAPADGTKDLPAEADKSSLGSTLGNTVLVSSSLSQSTTPDNKVIEKIDNELKSVENVVKADSITNEDVTKNTEDPLVNEAQNKEDKAASGLWRMNFALTPQYTTKTIQPVANDEVLMIDLKNNASNQEQIGLGIAVGVGRAITPAFYIDAQLTYHQVKQKISYSYGTGDVDTLLVLQQSDGSIIVSPVYDMHTSEITSKYSYGGLRISGTYYFWSKPGRRFNITAGAGIDQLLSSSLEEKIDGESILTEDYLNKTNYSFVLGAGYNIRFRRGWELMINPTMTYYLLSEKSENSLYNFNQRSYGLNFMLSKTISFKK